VDANRGFADALLPGLPGLLRTEWLKTGLEVADIDPSVLPIGPGIGLWWCKRLSEALLVSVSSPAADQALVEHTSK